MHSSRLRHPCLFAMIALALGTQLQAQAPASAAVAPGDPAASDSTDTGAASAPLAATPAAPQPRPPLRVGAVTITGSVRARAEGWQWFSAPDYDDQYAFGAFLIRAAATYSRPRVDLQVEVSQPTLIGLPENSTAPAPQGQLGLGATYRSSSGSQDASIFLKQAFIRIKNIGSPANAVRLGRVEFADGGETAPGDASLAWLKRERIAHRLIGNFGFTHIQRSFDAVQASHNTPRLNLTLFAGLPTQGVFQLNGQGSIRDVNIQYAAATLPAGSTDARLFAVRYQDGRGLVPTDNRPADVRAADRETIEVYSLGGHLLRTVPLARGSIDLLLWGVVQSGDWGTQEHRAYAVAAEAGFQPALPLRPWIRAGYLVGSGDDAPETAADGEHRTFFQVLPTPRIYARTPFHNLMNSEDLFVQLLLRPGTRTTLRADLHRLSLADPGDLWYAGGGAFDTSTFGFAGRPAGGESELATVLDLSIDRQLGASTALSFYAGRVFGGAVISRLHPAGADANYGYLEVTRRF